ncbi:MAG: hypothetical protein IJH12_01710 [Clostridia bacterium]|nr:hypothetical protein [Clostridia bacterium]
MSLIENIKKFIDEKILKKESQKLLMAPIDTEETEENVINLISINNFIKQDKYGRNLYVSFGRIRPAIKKKLLNNIEIQLKGILNTTHDDTSLLEGQISGENFISVRRKNVPLNKVGQSILMDSGYIDISTRKKAKENKYSNLAYKEYKKNDQSEELFEYNQEDESYSRKIKIGNVTYFESACYVTENEIGFLEDNAQPDDEKRALEEYERITKLTYISRDEKHNISNGIRANPFLVKIEAFRQDKNGNIVVRKSINTIYKSKKECIVGYRPKMIFIESAGRDKENNKMYRLTQDEGLYVDNSTFKQNFEGKYSIKKVSLGEIEQTVKEIPFSISQETKNILRNGYDVPIHIKKIYETGLAQIHSLGLDRIKRIDE